MWDLLGAPRTQEEREHTIVRSAVRRGLDRVSGVQR